MRVSVINAWGENRGDEAMHRALIAHIWNVCPDAAISVYCYGSFDLPRAVVQYSTRDVPLAGLTAFFSAPGLSTLNGLLKEIFGSARNQPALGRHFFRESDLVISGPAGPYIGDTYPKYERACLARIKIATLTGKPCVIAATSAGGFPKSWRNGFRKIMLHGVKWWTLREPRSYQAVRSLELTDTETELTSDIVFSRKIDFSNADIQQSEQQELLRLADYTNISTLGVTITTTPYIEESGKTHVIDRNDYVETMGHFLKGVVDLTGCQLLFFSHHYGQLDEMAMIREIINKLSSPTCCRVFPSHLNSDCQQLGMRRLTAHISQRYHPTIFALAEEVPVFCIVHQFKSAGLLELFDYPVSMPTSISSCEEWKTAFTTFWQRREEVRQAISRQLPRVRDLALRTVTRLTEELQRRDIRGSSL